jgi:signal transduction histidine kinase/ligand-binding sensor domain-containing protein
LLPALQRLFWGVFKSLFLRIAARWAACLGLLLVLAPVGAVSNPAWFSRSWQTEDGLPEHTIVGLAQTPDGYLWVATREGLFRFDGVRFQEFTPAMRAGSPPGQIRALLMDHRGRLWVARDGGGVVCVRDGLLDQVVVLGEGLFKDPAQNLCEDATGDIWVSESAGAVYRIHEGSARVFGSAEGLTKDQCRLAADVQGRAWFSQGGKAGFFEAGRFKPVLELKESPLHLARARQGGVWLCSDTHLYRCSERGFVEQLAELQTDPSRSALEVTALYEDKSHGLWIGTASSGLLRYDEKGVQSVDATLPAITALAEDSEGDIWVGTRGSGLNRFRPRAAELVGVTSGLPFVAVQSACEDASGTLWVAGQNGNLARFDGGIWKPLSLKDGWAWGAVSCLTAEPDGGVALGTRAQGVFRWKDGVFTSLPINQKFTNVFIRSIFSRTNGELWVSPNSGGILYRYRQGSLHTFALPPGSIHVRAMTSGSHSNLWAATVDGRLLQIVGESLSDATTNIPYRLHQSIRCLQSTDDGSLWIGFAGQGLGRLKNGHYFEFHRRDGLWDEYVSQILADDRGWLWIGGNRGIYKMARAELESVAGGHPLRARSVVLGRGDGLPALQASFGVSPVSARCQDGRLLMPMQTGLAVIQPNMLRRNALPPPVNIELLRVNGHTVAGYALATPPVEKEQEQSAPLNLRALPPLLRLGPGVNQIEFEFTALSLSSPENVTFRYKLQGVDNDWLEARSTRTASYPRLSPGNYRFRVIACNHDGVWNENGDTLSFSIKPYLWEAGWFRVAMSIAVLSLLGGGLWLGMRRRYRRRIQRLELRQAVERERTRIAQDLHDDLGSGLVEINLGSELAQDPTLAAHEMREHILEIGARAREMVTALDEIVWAVNPKHDTVSSLATYFCQFTQHFLKTTAVRCHLEVARELPSVALTTEQRHNLFLAFKQALSNAVQHSGATELRLSIDAPDAVLSVTLADNGRGLDLAATPEQVGADGLNNMRHRLHELGGHCKWTSHPGQGTSVTFTLPLPASRQG